MTRSVGCLRPEANGETIASLVTTNQSHRLKIAYIGQSSSRPRRGPVAVLLFHRTRFNPTPCHRLTTVAPPKHHRFVSAMPSLTKTNPALRLSKIPRRESV